jgi:hypothetical protein
MDYIIKSVGDPWSFIYHVFNDKPVPINDNRRIKCLDKK